MPDTDKNGAVHLMQAIQRSVAKLNIEHKTSPASDQVTVSMGASTRSATGGGDKLALFQSADAALYQAKQNGRNQFVCVDFVENKKPL